MTTFKLKKKEEHRVYVRINLIEKESPHFATYNVLTLFIAQRTCSFEKLRLA